MDRAWNCTANLPETSAAGPNLPLTLQLAPSRLSRSPLTAGATAPMVVAARTAGPCPPGHSGPPPRANQRISSPKTRGSSWYSTLHFPAGLDWWWLCATAAPPAAGFAAAARAFSASKFEQRDRARFVAPSDLDKSGCALLNRAQSAIKAVLSSEVYADGLLGQGVGEAVLRRHEWEIALALRDIAGLRGQLSL